MSGVPEIKIHKVYCVNCIHFVQHIHPFYPHEMMEACLSKPRTKGNYMNRNIEYALPAEKNKENTCPEYAAKFSIRFRCFLKKIFQERK
jgi:hypothetical protein